MLQRVIMSVQENIIPTLQHLTNNLNKSGVDTVIAGDCINEDKSANSDPSIHDGKADKSALYITDSESAYHTLRQQGKYVLPYRHEGNSDMNFAGALYVIEQIEDIDYETVDMAYRRLAGLPWEILTTKRCIIRETMAEDIDSFYQIYAEPEITKYMEDLYADRD